MSAELDTDSCDLVTNLIPVVKKRVLRALEHSREDVEFEIAPVALVTIKEVIATKSQPSSDFH